MDNPRAYHLNDGHLACPECHASKVAHLFNVDPVTTAEFNDLLWEHYNLHCDICGVKLDSIAWSPSA